MSAQTPEERLAEVMGEHGDWRWDMRVYEGYVRAQCFCGEVLGRGDLPTIDAALRAHQAAVVLAHLTAEGWAQGREAMAKAWEQGHSAGIAAYATQTSAKNNPYGWEPVEGGPA